MATVLPFKAFRPSNDKVHLVASRSVDGYHASELKDKLSGNPYTFLHVINPDFHDGEHTKPGSRERLSKVKKRFKSFVREKILKRDEKPAYYIYRQIKNDHEYLGIIACTSIDDYMNGVIKVHEQTITQREEKLKEYLEVCEFNAEPVLFCYPNNDLLDELIDNATHIGPDYDFTTTDKVRHSVWVVNDSSKLNIIEQQFSKIPAIYIADGHHRSASSALLGLTRRRAQKKFTGHEAFNYYLGVFFSETQLKIYDYNRVVKDLNGLTIAQLLGALSEKFVVEEKKGEIFKPTCKHELSMYTDGKWYSLIAKEGTYRSNDPVGSLDASILTEHILSPLLDIHDLKTDKRIGFIPGIKGAEALKQNVDEGKSALAFGLFPVTMEQLKWIADTNNVMPPKSTWVEPKMRSGLVIYSFDEND
ncbi:MAG: DUF1015 domain-containing protein [Bacteroidia bacterium]|nr:DUF1015 domain-containing protein [Bacteroidia bacterium]